MRDGAPHQPPSQWPEVLCLGEILYDRIADQVTSSVALVQSWTNYPGGAPANVACGLSQLGTAAGFIGAVGQDDAGKSLLHLLKTHRIDTQGVQIMPQYPTRTVLVMRRADGDRQFVAFGDTRRSTEFADAHLDAQDLPIDLLTHAKFLVVGSLGLAAPTSQTAVQRAMTIAQQSNCPICLDVNWRPVFWPYPERAKPQILTQIQAATLLKMSEAECQWLFGQFDDATIPTIRAQFPQLQGIFVTLGAGGCNYWLNGYAGHCPTFNVNAVDTTGAGDGFVAGLLHQLCRIADLKTITPPQAAAIVTYANAVAALTTTGNGAITAQPHPDTVQQLLQHHLLG